MSESSNIRLNISLLASAVRAASGTQLVASSSFSRFRRGLFLLDVTSAATLAGDTLDVYIQKNVAGPGATAVWTDFIHFTQALGNGGAKQFVAEVTSDSAAPTSTMHAVQDASIAAGVNIGPWSDDWRIKWVEVGTGSFTFSLAARLSA